MVTLKAAAVIALVTGFTSLAAPASATERWHTSTLKWVYPLAHGDFVLGFDADSSACTNIGSPKYMYVSVGENGVTADGAQKMYAAALTAFAIGKTLTIAFDDATTQCYVNRLIVNK